MKYKTFEALLLNCKELYDTACIRDKKLQEVLGGDSQVMTDWWSKYIEETINIISKDIGDEHEVVDWLFWESMCNNNGYVSFWEDDIEYLGSPQNVWLDLKGKLNEGYSKNIKYEFIENDASTHFSKEDKANAHNTVEELEENKGHSILSKDEMAALNKIAEETKTDQVDAHRNRKIILLKDKQIQLEDREKAKKLEKMVIKDLEDPSMSLGGFIQILVLAYNAVNDPLGDKLNDKETYEIVHSTLGEVNTESLEQETETRIVDVPIPNKDFKDNKEFYNYIKYLFECSGVTVIEVDKPFPSDEDNFKYKLKTRKFETWDFNSEIKDLIYEENIFVIYLYSASFIDVEGTKTNYNIRLDWSNKC